MVRARVARDVREANSEIRAGGLVRGAWAVKGCGFVRMQLCLIRVMPTSVIKNAVRDALAVARSHYDSIDLNKIIMSRHPFRVELLISI